MFGFFFKKKNSDVNKANNSSNSSLNITTAAGGSQENSTNTTKNSKSSVPLEIDNAAAKISKRTPALLNSSSPTAAAAVRIHQSKDPSSDEISSSFPARTQTTIKNASASNCCSIPISGSSNAPIAKNESVSLCDLTTNSASSSQNNNYSSFSNSRSRNISNTKPESSILITNPTTNPTTVSSLGSSSKNKNSLALKEKFLAQSLPKKLSDDDNLNAAACSALLPNTTTTTLFSIKSHENICNENDIKDFKNKFATPASLKYASYNNNDKSQSDPLRNNSGPNLTYA